MPSKFGDVRVILPLGNGKIDFEARYSSQWMQETGQVSMAS